MGDDEWDEFCQLVEELVDSCAVAPYQHIHRSVFNDCFAGEMHVAAISVAGELATQGIMPTARQMDILRTLRSLANGPDDASWLNEFDGLMTTLEAMPIAA